MVDVQHHRRKVGKLEAVVDAVGLFLVLEGDAITRLGRESRPDRADAFAAQATGYVHVAFEVLELPTEAHHADHVGVIFELGQAVLDDLRLVRAEHAILTRVQRQPDAGCSGTLANQGKAFLRRRLHLGLTVEVGCFRMAVERQQVAAQAQHAQWWWQGLDVFEQA